MAAAPSDPSEELILKFELDPEVLRTRRWVERQMVAGGVSEFAAMRLSFLPDVDYRRVIHMHQLGMSDDLILNDYLD